MFARFAPVLFVLAACCALAAGSSETALPSRVEAFVQLGHTAPVLSFAISPGGRYAVSGAVDGQVKVWDLRNERELLTLAPHTSPVFGLAFTPDGKTLVTGGAEGVLKLYDVETMRLVRRIETGHTQPMFRVAVSLPDGRYVATASDDKTARIFNLQTGALVGTIAGHTGGVAAVAFSPDGKWFATGGLDQSIRIWDRKGGAQVALIAAPFAVSSLAFAPDGKSLLAGFSTLIAPLTTDSSVRLYEVPSGKSIREFSGHSGAVLSVAFSADGRRVLSGSGSTAAILARSLSDDSVIEWNAQTGETLRRMEGDRLPVRAVGYLPDGRVVSAGENAIRIWNLPSSAEPVPALADATHTESNCGDRRVVFAPRGRYRATCIGDRITVARVTDGGTGARTFAIDKRFHFARTTLSDDGEAFALASVLDGDISVWRTVDGRKVFKSTDPSFKPKALALSGDGAWLAASDRGEDVSPPGEPGTIRVWNVSSGALAATLKGHAGAVPGLAFSADGATLYSAGNDRTLRGWALPGGDPALVAPLEGDFIAGLALAPDGRRAAIAARLGKVIDLVDLRTGMHLLSLPTDREGASFKGMHFGADNATMLVEFDDGNLRRLSLAPQSHVMRGYGTGAQVVIDERATRTLTVFDARGAEARWDLESVRQTEFQVKHVGPIKAASGLEKGGVVALSVAPQEAFRMVARDTSGKYREAFLAKDEAFVNEDVAKFLSKYVDREAVASKQLEIQAELKRQGIDIETNKEWDATEASHPVAGMPFALSRDGRIAAFGPTYVLWSSPTIKNKRYAAGRLYLWDLSHERQLGIVGEDIGYIHAIALTPDARRALIVSEPIVTDKENDGQPAQISLWDLQSGKPIYRRSAAAYRNADDMIGISPDGHYAVVVARSGDAWGQLIDLNSGESVQPLRGHDKTVKAVTFSADGRWMASAGFDHVIQLWDTQSWKIVRSLTGHTGTVMTLSISDDGTRIISGAEDASVRIWNALTGDELVRLVSFDNGDWVAITPEGYFNASPGGAEQLSFRLGLELYPLDQLYDVFYRPDLVQRKIAGEDIRPYIAISAEQALANPPPRVQIEQMPGLSPGGKITLKYTVDGAMAGIGDVRVFHNGKLIASDGFYRAQGEKSSGTLRESVQNATGRLLPGAASTFPRGSSAVPAKPNVVTGTIVIDPVPGENHVSVAAFNGANTVQSRIETANFRSEQPAEPPRLFIIAIGINRYRDREAQLSFAVKDAADLSRAIAAHAADVFGKGRIQPVVLLTDAAASKAGILNRLEEVGRTMRPQDTLVFSAAGHGVIEDGVYSIVTQDYDGKLNPSNMITAQEIMEVSKKIRGLRQLWILDTCYAGGINNFFAGLYDARLTVMARNMGLHIYAAAGSEQEARDGYRGNGLFTHALLDAITGGKADLNRDGRISAVELGDYSRGEVIDIAKRIKYRQTPLIMKFGQDMPLTAVPDWPRMGSAR